MKSTNRLHLESLENRIALSTTQAALAPAMGSNDDTPALVAPLSPAPQASSTVSAAASAVAANFDPPNPDPVDPPLVVDPVVPGLAPIALPPIGINPPQGTVPVTLPPTGGLPTEIPPLAGAAETLGVNAMTAFADAHPNSDLTVTPTIRANSYSVSVLLRDGNDFASYHVSETRNVVSVSLVVFDGSHREIIWATQSLRPNVASLVHMKFDNGALTEGVWVRQVNGVETIDEYPQSAVAASAAYALPLRQPVAAAPSVAAPLKPALTAPAVAADSLFGSFRSGPGGLPPLLS